MNILKNKPFSENKTTPFIKKTPKRTSNSTSKHEVTFTLTRVTTYLLYVRKLRKINIFSRNSCWSAVFALVPARGRARAVNLPGRISNVSGPLCMWNESCIIRKRCIPKAWRWSEYRMCILVCCIISMLGTLLPFIAATSAASVSLCFWSCVSVWRDMCYCIVECMQLGVAHDFKDRILPNYNTWPNRT